MEAPSAIPTSSSTRDTEEIVMDIVGQMVQHETLQIWLKKILDDAGEMTKKLDWLKNEVRNEVRSKSLDEVMDSVKRASVMPEPGSAVAAFQTILAWIRHDPPARAVHLDALMVNLDFAKVDQGNDKLLDREFRRGILPQSFLCSNMYRQVQRKRAEPLISLGSSTSIPFPSLPRSTVSFVFQAFLNEFKKLIEETSCIPTKANLLPSRSVSRVSELLRTFHQSFQHMTSIKSHPRPTVPHPLTRTCPKMSKKRPSKIPHCGPNGKVARLQGTSVKGEASAEFGEDENPGSSKSTTGMIVDNHQSDLVHEVEVVSPPIGDEDENSEASAEVGVPRPTVTVTQRKTGRHPRGSRTTTSHIIFHALFKRRPHLYSYSSKTQKKKPLCEISVFPAFCATVVVGNCLYKMGGVLASKHSYFTDSKHGMDTVDIYNLRGKCQRRTGPTMLTKRKEAAGVVLGDFIYITGGTHSNLVLGLCERLNWTDTEETAQWEELPAFMKVPRSGHAVVVLNDEMYAIGGVGEDLTTLESDSVEKYNFEAETWSLVRPLLEPRARTGVAVLNGKIYVLGGVTTREKQPYDFDRLKSGEVYDPSFNLWLPVAPMNVTRREPVVVVDKGRLVVIGGNHGPASSEIYDPINGNWKFVSSKSAFGSRNLLHKMNGSGFEAAVEALL